MYKTDYHNTLTLNIVYPFHVGLFACILKTSFKIHNE